MSSQNFSVGVFGGFRMTAVETSRNSAQHFASISTYPSTLPPGGWWPMPMWFTGLFLFWCVRQPEILWSTMQGLRSRKGGFAESITSDFGPLDDHAMVRMSLKSSVCVAWLKSDVYFCWVIKHIWSEMWNVVQWRWSSASLYISHDFPYHR